MQEPQNTTAYRLSLALSLAFCLHILLFLAIGQWPQPPRPDDPRVVEVRLTQPGSDQQSPETTDSTPGDDAEPEDVETQPSETEPESEPVITTEEPSQRRPTASAPALSSPGGSPASESIRQLFGGDSAPETDDTEAPVARISEQDGPELSEYELKLWEAIAREVRYHDVFAELTEVQEVTLGLRMMGNGALERTRIDDSSGDERLDSIARQAALSASPYPEPPETSRWFTVRLRFMPDGHRSE